jgi:hypothetical protein
MARWKNPGHAQSPFFILGRVGKLSEEEIWRAWNSSDREPLIQSVLKSVAAKSSRRTHHRALTLVSVSIFGL